MNQVGLYPRNLTYMVKKLANYSRNTFKISTLNQTTASPSQQIIVDLPSNTLVDMNSLTMFFKYTTTGNSDLPRNVEGILQRVETEINGQIVNGGANDINQLWQIISDTSFGEDVTNRRKILQKGTDATVPAASVSTATQCAIQTFLGFTSSVPIVNTRVLGNVRLRLTLAPASVMVKAAGVTTESFSLSDIFFSVDCFDLDNMFHEATEKYLASGGVIEIPFSNYFSFSSSASSLSQTAKFSLSTQSLNKVWGCFVTGANYPAQATSATAADFCNKNTNNSPFFTRVANGTVRYGQGGTNYQDITYAMTNYQWNINGTMYPNYKPTPEQAYALLMNAYNLSQDTLGGGYKGLDTLAKWGSDFWVCCQNFEHLSESGDRWLSGLDTRGNIASGFWETQGSITVPAATGTGGTNPASNLIALIFAHCTSTLRVSYGRQIEVVQ